MLNYRHPEPWLVWNPGSALRSLYAISAGPGRSARPGGSQCRVPGGGRTFIQERVLLVVGPLPGGTKLSAVVGCRRSRSSACGYWPGRVQGGGTNYYKMNHPPSGKTCVSVKSLRLSKGRFCKPLLPESSEKCCVF